MNRTILNTLSSLAFALLITLGTALSVVAQVSFYTDRAAFEADFPGLPLEDFEESPVAAGEVLTCLDLINSGTTGPCFQPGEIIPGVDFTYDGSPGFTTFTRGDGNLGGHQADIVWGPRFFEYPMLLIFTDVTFAAGMDIYIDGGGNVDIFVLDTGGGTIGFTSISPSSTEFLFMGVESASQIGSIVIEGVGFTNEYIDNFSMSDIPIPVELVSFNAVVNGTDVSLTWATASETNNAGFEVQVQNGEDWNVLAFVEGHGTTTEAQTYGYTAADMAVGTHSFRLKQIDYDGAFEYHGEVEATIETPGTHLISSAYPNPFNPQSQFTLAVAQDQHVTAELFNTLGKRIAVLFAGTVEANQVQSVTIDGAGLPSGMYIVRVIGDRFSDALSVTLLK